MPVPQLSPASTVSTSILTSTGSTSLVVAALPFTVYSTSAAFISGAADQVAYVYKKLGGDVLDIEIKAENVAVKSKIRDALSVRIGCIFYFPKRFFSALSFILKFKVCNHVHNFNTFYGTTCPNTSQHPRCTPCSNC